MNKNVKDNLTGLGYLAIDIVAVPPLLAYLIAKAKVQDHKATRARIKNFKKNK